MVFVFVVFVSGFGFRFVCVCACVLVFEGPFLAEPKGNHSFGGSAYVETSPFVFFWAACLLSCFCHNGTGGQKGPS